MDKSGTPASAVERREREEKIEFRGLLKIPDILGSSAELTLLGTPDNNIQTGTLRITDNAHIGQPHTVIT